MVAPNDELEDVMLEKLAFGKFSLEPVNNPDASVTRNRFEPDTYRSLNMVLSDLR
jgi:hypothetical protein